ncbi:MAG TPA: squalene synthase HpnC [Jatrophihabitans sp.]|nr:squalene synthase HpnC [Jatrophihabitans sp.]
MVSSADARRAAPTGSPGGGAPDAIAELSRIATAAAAQIGGENFPVALRVLPRQPRDHLQRAYAFARFVDDVGDESHGDRLALLDAVDRDIDALPEGAARLTPVRDLGPLVHQHRLALQPLHDLVEANRRDQLVSRYETFEDLLDYCRLSAAPVGRMVLAVADVDDADAAARSDKICAALQVLEHCQDVGEDAAAGRVYLPAHDLAAAGVGDADLRRDTTSPALRRVLALQIERAGRLLDEGKPLIKQLHGWARLAVLGYVAGGRATAAAIRRADYDVLARTVRPSKPGTVWHAARLAAGR